MIPSRSLPFTTGAQSKQIMICLMNYSLSSFNGGNLKERVMIKVQILGKNPVIIYSVIKENGTFADGQVLSYFHLESRKLVRVNNLRNVIKPWRRVNIFNDVFCNFYQTDYSQLFLLDKCLIVTIQTFQ